MTHSAERLARNQALFREVNERINEFMTARTVSFREFICECTNASCTESLAVAGHEYEAVRLNSKHFLVARGHELPEVERGGRGQRTVLDRRDDRRDRAYGRV